MSTKIEPTMSAETPEQLLDAFRAAALSVTKLYKTSAAAQTQARSNGYQDCLDDLLAFLDRADLGLTDGEGWQIRQWATERLDGRDAVSQESEEDENSSSSIPTSNNNNNAAAAAAAGTANDKPDTRRATSAAPPSTTNARPSEVNMRDSAPPAVVEEPEIAVPTRDAFSFQAPPSQHVYPHDAHLGIASLDLSDSLHAPRQPRRSGARAAAARGTTGSNLGRGAGQKRKINFAEIFDLGSLGHGGKDPFGSGGKRSRHA